MLVKTILLPIDKAAIIQQRHAEFECTLVEIGVSSNNSARITVSGPEEKVEQLLKLAE